MCVWHDLSEAIHRLVQIMHPLPFSTVNFQPLILHLFLAELRSGFALTAHAAAVRPALAGLTVCSVLVAVLLEHLIGEEAPCRVIHHQVWRRGATAGGASIGIHFSCGRKFRNKNKDPKKPPKLLNRDSLSLGPEL